MSRSRLQSGRTAVIESSTSSVGKADGVGFLDLNCDPRVRFLSTPDSQVSIYQAGHSVEVQLSTPQSSNNRSVTVTSIQPNLNGGYNISGNGPPGLTITIRGRTLTIPPSGQFNLVGVMLPDGSTPIINSTGGVSGSIYMKSEETAYPIESTYDAYIDGYSIFKPPNYYYYIGRVQGYCSDGYDRVYLYQNNGSATLLDSPSGAVVNNRFNVDVYNTYLHSNAEYYIYGMVSGIVPIRLGIFTTSGDEQAALDILSVTKLTRLDDNYYNVTGITGYSDLSINYTHMTTSDGYFHIDHCLPNEGLNYIRNNSDIVGTLTIKDGRLTV